jgi:uncharacterized protein
MEKLTPAVIIEKLSMQPLPVEGGMIAQSWRDDHSSAIYYLLEAPQTSGLHRLRNVEVFQFHGGAPAKMLLLHESGEVEEPVLGLDLRQGQRPQVVVPGGTWQATETLGEWSLLGTYMSPPYSDEDIDFGKSSILISLYPSVAERIRRLGR